ncbi:MAG: DNA-directed RNA polymerase [Candidatus Marsarchaeota archaeon]|nr:DNA-directed RNA polymerase [Candidatus Marsarchaeota archaeon]
MYYVHTVKDTISIPPSHFGEDINKAAKEILRSRYERTMNKQMGIIIALFNVKDISDGTILPGDPSTHHTVTFDLLSFNLDVGEIVVGEVSELVDFGCFVRLGPIDGLVHMSQITNDYINYDRKTGTFVLRNTKRSIKKGDVVYAKISTVSLKSNIKDAKIALTMRPDGLGKPEWLKEPKAREKSVGRKGTANRKR